MEVEEETESWFSTFVHQLSGIMVIIIIAGGILICLLLFIFAKRQIVRFAIRSHRGTTTPGADSNKSMRREIIRRLDAIKKITYEPKMLQENAVIDNGLNDLPCHYYRMKTMDESKNLEDSVFRKKLGKRQNFESLRSYLITALNTGVEQRVIHQYCDLYEGARFNPKPYSDKDYKQFLVLLQQLRTAVVQLEPRRSVRGGGTTRDSGNIKGSAENRSKRTEKISGTADIQVAMTDSTHHHIIDSSHQHESTQV